MPEQPGFDPGAFALRAESFGGLLLHVPSERLLMVSPAQHDVLRGLLAGTAPEETAARVAATQDLSPAAAARLVAATVARLERPEAFDTTPEMIRTFTEHLSAPINVVWQFTGACNLKCRHCFIPAEDHTADQAAPPDLLRIARTLVEKNTLIVRLSGGEPARHKALPAILEVLKSTPRHVKLLTNATLVDDRLIAVIARHVDSLSVSLDGATAATHDGIRGQAGAFDRTVDGLRRLRAETGARINVTTSVFPENLPEIGAILDLCAEIGVHSWKHTLAIPIGRAGSDADALAREAEFAALMRAVEPYRGHPMVAGAIHLLDAYIDPEPAPTWCGGAFDEVAIDPSGRLFPCAYVSGLDRYGAGNLLEADFDALYGGSAFRQFRRDGEIDLSPDCKAVRLAYFGTLTPERTVYDPAAIRAMLTTEPAGGPDA